MKWSEFKKELQAEQAMYNTSLRARLVGYESFYIGRYLWYLRLCEWFAANYPPR